jgi:nitrogen fixation protein FixH
MAGRQAGGLTGRTVLAIALGGFAVVLAVNIGLVVAAVGTFPGLVVANAYVASQSFDRDRAAQDALGWRVAVTAEAGRLAAEVTGPDGRAVPGAAVHLSLARGGQAPREIELVPGIAAADPPRLAPGLWIARVTVTAPGGALWKGTARLDVRAATP